MKFRTFNVLLNVVWEVCKITHKTNSSFPHFLAEVGLATVGAMPLLQGQHREALLSLLVALAVSEQLDLVNFFVQISEHLRWAP